MGGNSLSQHIMEELDAAFGESEMEAATKVSAEVSPKKKRKKAARRTYDNKIVHSIARKRTHSTKRARRPSGPQRNFAPKQKKVKRGSLNVATIMERNINCTPTTTNNVMQQTT